MANAYNILGSDEFETYLDFVPLYHMPEPSGEPGDS